jgi:hypothetical protein
MKSDIENIRNPRKPLPGRAVRTGLVLLVSGILLCVGGYLADEKHAAFNNVVSFLFLTGIGAGSLFLVALEYIAGAVWSVPMRRINEFLSGLLPFAALLAIPLFFYLPEIFSWAGGEHLHDNIVQSKLAYLNVNFFSIRFAAIFCIWILFLTILSWNSLKQDITGDQKHTRRNIIVSGIFLPFFAIGITLLPIDWAMSLEPDWYSTIFGVYYFSGSVVAALAVLTLVTVYLFDHGYFPFLRADHFYNLGALMFTFVNFWAYIAFSQFMLIWYSNLPEETSWFIMRWKNGWEIVSVVLILIHFWVPYFMLLSQESKMNLKRLKYTAILLIAAHFTDMYWLVMPSFNNEFQIGWVEAGFPILEAGLVILLLSWMMKRRNYIPVNDPKMKRALKFHL